MCEGFDQERANCMWLMRFYLRQYLNNNGDISVDLLGIVGRTQTMLNKPWLHTIRYIVMVVMSSTSYRIERLISLYKQMSTSQLHSSTKHLTTDLCVLVFFTLTCAGFNGVDKDTKETIGLKNNNKKIKSKNKNCRSMILLYGALQVVNDVNHALIKLDVFNSSQIVFEADLKLTVEVNVSTGFEAGDMQSRCRQCFKSSWIKHTWLLYEYFATCRQTCTFPV